MTSDQLLSELQIKDVLSGANVAKVKRESLISGRSVEEIIADQQLAKDDQVATVKSQILGIPYKKLDVPSIDAALLELVPEQMAQTYGVVPISMQDNILVVGMLNPDDVKAQDALKFLANQHNLNLGLYIISYSDWRAMLGRYSPYKSSIESAIRSLSLKPGENNNRRTVALQEDLSKGGADAPVIKMVADTFKEAVQSRASDVHFEPQENHLRVRFRIDGDLKEIAQIPGELSSALVSRIKVVSNLKIDESRVPQDGRFRARIMDREIDFRVATFPTPLGEKVAIRVLDPTTGLKNFEALGFQGANLEKVKRGLEKPFGMLLLSGPTGSGKTTTLYAMLQKLNEESVNIVSLEDPVEYFIQGINQSQVRPEIGYDFASGLRQILRQDPDVIMVGEMRDDETAGLAVQSALTGHIVLSTLHANNAAGVIPRLIDMKVEPYLLPAALSLMISQRLVGKVCSKCKEEYELPDQFQEIVKKDLADLDPSLTASFKPPYKAFRGKGCAVCKGKGILGRMQIHEVMEMTPQLEEIIVGGPTIQKIQNEAKRQGMITLRQDGILKALSGEASFEEVVGTTEEV